MLSMLKNSSTRFLIILVLLALLFKFSCMIYVVNGESMSPTYHSGYYGLAIRTTLTDIDRFDVVVIKYENKYLVKRVIGLPGDTVAYKDNKLFINNEYIYTNYGSGSTQDFEVTLDNSHYWCMGDNREHSSDSRVYGPFAKNKIKAVISG